ncbi:hypothetical protein BDU57DRAFT_524801 [Ampelomyces quisqualis]|uniref:Uncharacterized protein n=1 Tax=Ampelomyces quisqualis TaxID=50730 RepID=A0A6A5Q4W5_AMPQU|nr:hypothetical protein BDU57DRAFT_524801 [Ampelomyces quisqualis]
MFRSMTRKGLRGTESAVPPQMTLRLEHVLPRFLKPITVAMLCYAWFMAVEVEFIRTMRPWERVLVSVYLSRSDFPHCNYSFSQPKLPLSPLQTTSTST